MQINFIYRKIGSFGRVESLTHVKSYPESFKVDKNSIDERTFTFIQALVLNNEFEGRVINIRRKSSIPDEGYDFITKGASKRYNIKSVSISELLSKIDDKLVRELKEDYKIPNLLFLALKDIILMNIVHLPLPKLVVDGPYKPFEKLNPYSIKIVANSQVSRQEMHDFIDSNWIEINKFFEEQKSNSFYISERDLLIIRMKEREGLKFGQIADILNESGSTIVNEDSIKSAYHRARKNIDSLSKR